MRVHHFVVAMVVVTAAALSAGSAFAHTDAPGWNNPVRITNSSCSLDYTVVSAQYRTIVFGIFNNGTVAHGFDIGGPTSPDWSSQVRRRRWWPTSGRVRTSTRASRDTQR